MSTLLSAQSLCYNLSTSALFDGVTITLKKSDRIGLIGHNGCGKSTLLQLLKQTIPPSSGDVNVARHCRIASVEQHLPTHLLPLSLVDAVSERLLLSLGGRELSQHCLEPTEPLFERGPYSSVSAEKGIGGEEKVSNALTGSPDRWKVELLLSQLGFSEEQWQQAADQLSGGQHSRLLLARALVTEPDLLLLDEPSNHLDLPSLLWLESFLLAWSGSFVLVSHDQRLLDKVTNCTWIIRDQHILRFQLPCSLARQALLDKEAADAERYRTEQQEIQRIEKSAKRLAIWGREFDNENLARKAKSMGKRVDQLKEQQTVLSSQLPWCLQLKGEALAANRLLAIQQLNVCPTPSAAPLFYVENQRLKSGDRVAIIGQNGAGKSSLLRMLWGAFLQANNSDQGYTARELSLVGEGSVQFHPALRLGYYDQSLQQLADDDCLIDALYAFAPLPQEQRKMALIRAGFGYQRHSQKIAQLSGGERARVLFIGLTLARYHLLFLDEPTNHLDMEGKSELAATLNQYEGAVVLVSHDRDFIERSCQRFWVVSEQKVSGLQSLPLLQEYYDAESAYHALLNVQGSVVNTKYAQGAIVANNCEPQSDDSKLEGLTSSVTDKEVDNQTGKCFESSQEQLLQRLIELEALLKQDEGQSVKKQKPKQQQRWREEIFTLNQRLE